MMHFPDSPPCRAKAAETPADIFKIHMQSNKSAILFGTAGMNENYPRFIGYRGMKTSHFIKNAPADIVAGRAVKISERGMVLMKTIRSFAVVGGDLRQASLASSLASEGYHVYGMFFDRDIDMSDRVIRTNDISPAIADSEIVVLPLLSTLDNLTINTPLSDRKVYIKEIFEHIQPKSLLFSGGLTPQMEDFCQVRGIEYFDYLKREEFAVMNAVPTAEGAVGIAMQELPTTIYGSNCLITGYGRISKALVKILSGLGANITVAARKYGDLAWIKVFGCEAIHISQLKHHAHKFDILFNTVPAMILDEYILSRLKRECLVIDLASKPGGVDFEKAKNLSIKTIWALSLPGKTAPITSGEIIKDTIMNVIEERGELIIE